LSMRTCVTRDSGNVFVTIVAPHFLSCSAEMALVIPELLLRSQCLGS
jgi:hypothetical protein